MGFYCGCDGDDEWTVWRKSTHRAQKEYNCTECGQPIKPGDTYDRIFTVIEDRAETYFNCERCSDLMAAFSDVGYCWWIGGFLESYWEWLREEGKPIPKWLTDLRPGYAEDE